MKQKGINYQRLFKAFDAIQGMVKDDATNASTTIDDVLYGKPYEGLKALDGIGGNQK